MDTPFREIHFVGLVVGFSRMNGQGETLARSLAPFVDVYSPGLVGLRPLAVRRA
jgi:hypothetical protein